MLGFFPVVRIGTIEPPHPQASVSTRLVVGGTHSLGNRGGGSQFGRGDRHCGTLVWVRYFCCKYLCRFAGPSSCPVKTCKWGALHNPREMSANGPTAILARYKREGGAWQEERFCKTREQTREDFYPAGSWLIEAASDFLCRFNYNLLGFSFF